MDLTTFMQFFINGIVLGAIYVLLAIGLSIIFGMIGIVNLTHGILYMLGAYAAVSLTPYIGFFPNLRCEIVVEPDFFESYTKYPCA